MKTVTLVFVGGFLGAGKTTLITRAAEILGKREMHVAAIMNDQDRGLVDTKFTEAYGVPSREVAGGCFCCRFSDFLDVADQLKAYQPDVIFAEPVGSCVDLSATILQPLKAYYQDRYRLAPLTVLVDPAQLEQVGSGKAGSASEYLFKKQMSEADLLCLTKWDLHVDVQPDLSLPIDFRLSAKTGEGVKQWLDDILGCTRVGGSRLLEVDYEEYARAEASLGWLNLHAEVTLAAAVSGVLRGAVVRKVGRSSK